MKVYLCMEVWEDDRMLSGGETVTVIKVVSTEAEAVEWVQAGRSSNATFTSKWRDYEEFEVEEKVKT